MRSSTLLEKTFYYSKNINWSMPLTEKSELLQKQWGWTSWQLTREKSALYFIELKCELEYKEILTEQFSGLPDNLSQFTRGTKAFCYYWKGIISVLNFSTVKQIKWNLQVWNQKEIKITEGKMVKRTTIVNWETSLYFKK